jgi:hypothetical protein
MKTISKYITESLFDNDVIEKTSKSVNEKIYKSIKDLRSIGAEYTSNDLCISILSKAANQNRPLKNYAGSKFYSKNKSKLAGVKYFYNFICDQPKAYFYDDGQILTNKYLEWLDLDKPKNIKFNIHITVDHLKAVPGNLFTGDLVIKLFADKNLYQTICIDLK